MVGGVPIVTLPGNPVSSFVSFHVFVLPMIRLLAGRAADSDTVEVVAGADWPSADGKVEFTRVRVEGGEALPARGQGSHMLGALASANALAVVPADTAYVRSGDTLAAVSLLGLEHPR
jgi:molybdopterin molybdotransferase